MGKTCCIYGAGEYFGGEFNRLPADKLIIAADAGYERVCKAGIKPDIAVGDFDSLGTVPSGIPAIRHPAEKDDTDMLLAVKQGFSVGCKRFFIFGGTGGRLDHTIANLQLLTYIADNGGEGFAFGDGTVVSAIKNSTFEFGCGFSGVISVFALGETASGVYLRGLKYPLENAVLTCSVPLGVSNEFMRRASFITVENGTLTVMWTAPSEGTLPMVRPNRY